MSQVKENLFALNLRLWTWDLGLLKLFYLFHARGVAASGLELRLEPGAYDLWNRFGRCGARAQSKNVGVIVLASEPRGLFRPRDGSAYARHLLGGDSHARPGPAD